MQHEVESEDPEVRAVAVVRDCIAQAREDLEDRVRLWLRRRKTIMPFTTEEGALVDALMLEVFGSEEL